MTMVMVFSLFCLLACIALALPHLTTALPVTAAADNDKLSLIDPTSIKEVEGWSMEFPANFISDATITLPDAKTSRHCLESCYGNVPGCRFVQYNLDTWQCTGFRVYVEGNFRPHTSMSLLVVSKKHFTPRIGGHIGNPPGGQVHISGADGQHVVNHLDVSGEALCVLLCHIHPRCKATDSEKNNSCSLHTSNTPFETGPDWVNWVSYMS